MNLWAVSTSKNICCSALCPTCLISGIWGHISDCHAHLGHTCKSHNWGKATMGPLLGGNPKHQIGKKKQFSKSNQWHQARTWPAVPGSLVSCPFHQLPVTHSHLVMRSFFFAILQPLTFSCPNWVIMIILIEELVICRKLCVLGCLWRRNLP